MKNATLDLDRFVEEMPVAHVLCRELRHAWKWDNDGLYNITARNSRNQPTEVSRSLTCARCKMQRVDYFNITATTMTRSKSLYHAPKGAKQPYYARHLPKGRTVLGELRSHTIRRLVGDGLA